MVRKELQLVAVGNVAASFLQDIQGPIQQVLGVESYMGKTFLPAPTFAFNKDRDQFHTSAIMRRLVTVRDPGTPLVLGVTDCDLFVPDSTFVYGEADRESHAAVMSLFRLQATEGDAWKRRAHVEAVHLAGHLVGLSYCEDSRCAMFFATTITDAERRQLSLCNNCRNELAKVRRM